MYTFETTTGASETWQARITHELARHGPAATAMPLPEPFRGEVRDVDFDEFGLHPAVVLSINSLNAQLGHVAVIPVTGTAGPDQTHVPLTADAGLTRYDESYADITALQPVDRARPWRDAGWSAAPNLRRRLGKLTVYLGI